MTRKPKTNIIAEQIKRYNYGLRDSKPRRSFTLADLVISAVIGFAAATACIVVAKLFL